MQQVSAKADHTDASASSITPEAIFVSDVHLQESMPRTSEAFFNFLQHHASRARRLFILGDLFEYWAGDDDLDTAFHQQVTAAIHRVSDGGTEIGWIPGNRDFLTGPAFANAVGASILPDPCYVTIAGRSLLLSHGDAYCTDDRAYMEFRSQVRNPAWQQQFLAMPLAKRKAIIEGMRQSSRDAQREKSYEIMDVNADAIDSELEAGNAIAMIHGHTHRPDVHEHGAPDDVRLRYVLPDWDCDDGRRGGWIEIDADGGIRRISL